MGCNARFVFDPMVLLETIGFDDITATAERLHSGRDKVYKWLKGDIRWTYGQADKYAIRAGYHPANVWGQQWWDEAIHDAEMAELRRLRKNARRHAPKEAHHG